MGSPPGRLTLLACAPAPLLPRSAFSVQQMCPAARFSRPIPNIKSFRFQRLHFLGPRPGRPRKDDYEARMASGAHVQA